MKFKWNDVRVAIGLIASIVWVGFGAWMWATNNSDSQMELNAWGDFFAGFSAPLAFLWLVLGYMQQGEELRNSSEALRLQATELRNSVEQQSELVKLSRAQLQRDVDAMQPRFVPIPGMRKESMGDTFVIQAGKLQNVGFRALNVLLEFSWDDRPPIRSQYPVVEHGADIPFELQVGHDERTYVKITYFDGLAMFQEMRFKVLLVPGGMFITELWDDA